MRVAGLGDATEPAALAGRGFFRHQSQEGHDMTWMREAWHVTQLGDEDGSGGQLETAQTHERLDRRIPPPRPDLDREQFIESLHPLRRLINGQEVFLQHSRR